MKIYHNPRCSKSRCALGWLQEKSFDFEVVDYLKNPLISAEIKSILRQLKMNAFDLLRKNETEYKEHIQGKNLKENEIIEFQRSAVLIYKAHQINSVKKQTVFSQIKLILRKIKGLVN